MAKTERRLEQNRRYKHSELGRAAKRRYSQSEKGRAQQAREYERFRDIPEKKNTKATGAAKRNAQAKHEVLVAYSQDPPSCACCQETIEAFLVLDHVNGGGGKHRTTGNFYHQLRKTGFPQDTPLQVLCCNCNWGKHVNGGVCPHKTR